MMEQKQKKKVSLVTTAKPKLSELEKKQKCYEKKVEDALNKGKVYRVIGNIGLGQVRKELHKRGFIETISNNWNNELYKLKDEELLEKAEADNEHEMVLLTKMLGEREPIFLWINRTNSYSIYQHVPVMNKINILYANFVTKDGLCQCVDNIRRHCGSKVVVHHPRCYTSENYKRFYCDYKLTIATSVVQYLNTRKEIDTMFVEDGTLSLAALDWAFQVIIVYSQQKEDDCQLMNTEYQDGCEWRLLSETHNAMVHLGAKFKITEDWKVPQGSEKSKCQTYFEGLKFMADMIKSRWPWRNADGYTNIWLLKPARTGEGQGIVLTDSPEKIKDHLEAHKYKPFIIQKYIEKPLLVYGTKFDIRQYFLITIDNNYLRAWSYPHAVVKFASKRFRLDDLNQAIHITNTAVQAQYTETSHPSLPQHHMWTIGTLVLYLNSFDKGYLWEEYTYPLIKKTLQTITIASVENIELKPGRFELFGIDWIITNDFKPYLLEINRCPSFEYYSPVSEIIVGKMTEDLIKVTVDYLKSPKASTGDFELIHEMRLPEKKPKGQFDSSSDDDDNE